MKAELGRSIWGSGDVTPPDRSTRTMGAWAIRDWRRYTISAWLTPCQLVKLGASLRGVDRFLPGPPRFMDASIAHAGTSTSTSGDRVAAIRQNASCAGSLGLHTVEVRNTFVLRPSAADPPSISTSTVVETSSISSPSVATPSSSIQPYTSSELGSSAAS